jgi:thioredoxin 1
VPALTDADFDARVVDARGLVLVDFWAPWCEPCARLSPTVEALASEHAGAVTVTAIDVEAHPAAPARHAVLSLPTVILFRDGAEVERLTGSPSEKRIRRALEKHLT